MQYNRVFYCTVLYSTVQCSEVQYSTVQWSTVQYSTVQYSTVQYSTVQYSAVKYSTVQYSTVQYSTVQYSTVQYSTVQYSTVQYSTIQYILRTLFLFSCSPVYKTWKFIVGIDFKRARCRTLSKATWIQLQPHFLILKYKFFILISKSMYPILFHTLRYTVQILSLTFFGTPNLKEKEKCGPL